jgi:hypothetical protein
MAEPAAEPADDPMVSDEPSVALGAASFFLQAGAAARTVARTIQLKVFMMVQYSKRTVR